MTEEKTVDCLLKEWMEELDDYDKLAAEGYQQRNGAPQTQEELTKLQSWLDRGNFQIFGNICGLDELAQRWIEETDAFEELKRLVPNFGDCVDYDKVWTELEKTLDYAYFNGWSYSLNGAFYGFVVWER